MPKARDLRILGISFEEGLRRMLTTPAAKSGKPIAKKEMRSKKAKTKG